MPIFNPVKLPSISLAKQKASNLRIAGLQEQKLEAEVKRLGQPKSVTMSGDWGSITAPQEVVSAFEKFQGQIKTPEDMSRATKWAFQQGAEKIEIKDPETQRTYRAKADGTWEVLEGTEAEMQAAQVVDPSVKTHKQIMEARKPEKPKYKVGEILPAVIEGEESIRYQVVGHDKEGMPIRKEISRGPRYKPTTTVNIDMGTTRTTKTQLEGKIIEGVGQLDSLYYVETLTKPEFQQYAASMPLVGKKARAEFLSKAGFKSNTEFLEEYGAWDAAVKKFTLEWRKYITGVAGGEREMRDIEKSTINVRDSHPTFVGKMKAIRIITTANVARARTFLEKGMDFTELTPAKRIELFEAAENQVEQYMSPKDREYLDKYLPSEEIILENMKKYGKSREEVVNKWMEKHKND